MPGGGGWGVRWAQQNNDTINTSPLSHVVALCSAQVCVPPSSYSSVALSLKGVCVCREEVEGGGGLQVFAIITALRGTKCG